jgi:hypothetical protein
MTVNATVSTANQPIPIRDLVDSRACVARRKRSTGQPALSLVLLPSRDRNPLFVLQSVRNEFLCGRRDLSRVCVHLAAKPFASKLKPEIASDTVLPIPLQALLHRAIRLHFLLSPSLILFGVSNDFGDRGRGATTCTTRNRNSSSPCNIYWAAALQAIWATACDLLVVSLLERDVPEHRDPAVR